MDTEDRSRESFEHIWREQGYRLLREDEEYRQLADSYKMKTASDYALFVIPLLIGVAFMDLAPIAHEMLRWVACAAVVVVAFVVCAWVKTAFGGAKSASDVEKRIKERCYERFRNGENL